MFLLCEDNAQIRSHFLPISRQLSYHGMRKIVTISNQ